eukprot:CAMPEP_0115090112 /NCGR_PEP_ID=MMETSP0227-20121206/25187_1 /TAXON_ID=89957 /ORGANISM="Polarella glacialis, Strain CCMP 1383" /LENGTH=37 /DNA_ID= /DNA_START= /DNA_END= /DNA_ORIENTATION=
MKLAKMTVSPDAAFVMGRYSNHDNHEDNNNNNNNNNN